MIKFGELLVQLKLLSERDLIDALQVAPQFGLPLGRTLVLSGKISEAELQLCVELQPLISQNLCSMANAARAARYVRVDKFTPVAALQKIGVIASTDKATLGCLLVDAALITAEQVEYAQKISYETGMRLGRVLTLNNIITHSLLTQALDLQAMIRQGRMSMSQAVQMLVTNAPKHALPVRLEAHGLKPFPAKKQVRFGEFLVMSGLASENEILNAMETSLHKQLSLGDAIVALGLVSESVFRRAEKLHEQVGNGEVTLTEATDEIYRLIRGADLQGNIDGSVETAPDAAPEHSADSDVKPLEQVNKTVGLAGDAARIQPLVEANNSLVLGELLKMTGFVNDSDISEAIELSTKYPALIGKMLVVSGAIDEATLIASLRCQYLLKHGMITVDQAVDALKYTRKNKVSFDDALEELGLSNKERQP
jgi:hypothetical protein